VRFWLSSTQRDPLFKVNVRYLQISLVKFRESMNVHFHIDTYKPLEFDRVEIHEYLVLHQNRAGAHVVLIQLASLFHFRGKYKT